MKEKRFVVRESYLSDFRSGSIVSNIQLRATTKKLGLYGYYGTEDTRIMDGVSGKVLLKASRIYELVCPCCNKIQSFVKGKLI